MAPKPKQTVTSLSAATMSTTVGGSSSQEAPILASGVIFAIKNVKRYYLLTSF